MTYVRLRSLASIGAAMLRSTDAVFICAPDLRFIYVNRQACAMLGYAARELSGLGIADVVAPDEAIRTQGSLKALRARVTVRSRTCLRRKSGTLVEVDVSATVLPDGNLFCFCRDISEQVHTQKSLQESEARFRRMFERNNAVMLLIEPGSGAIVDANNAASRFYGYAAEQLRSMTIDQINTLTKAQVAAQMALAKIEDRNYFIFSHRLASGAVRTVEVHSSPIDVGGRTLLFSITHDITARKAAEQQIEYLAFYDPLTRLPNRRLLLDRLQQSMASSARSRISGAVLFIDMDNFKILNDTSGHDVGDQLLVEIARRLSACVRQGDTVARLGGDEFVVLLDELSPNRHEAAMLAKLVGEKIRQALNGAYRIGGREHHSSPSIGVVLFLGAGSSREEVLKQADIAMYQAKSAGRNTLRFFDPEMQEELAARALLEAALRSAIQKREFVLHFQPQVDAVGRIVGAEALLRWERPGLGIALPDQFIPLSEETGLILPIGQWVLEAACARLAAWAKDARTSAIRLCINVSARQFRQRDFVQEVCRSLQDAGAPAARLRLELTESLILDDVEDSIEKMQALKRYGVGFSLDDFGTGYSSLSYLTRLPLDEVKIDQSFVRKLPDSATDAVVVQTIVTMAKSLGLAVIPEGVETEAQRQFLERLGCTTFQGYLFGRPVALELFERLLLR